MGSIDMLLRLARLYAEAEGVELTTVSSRVFDDGKKLSAIEQGADLQTRRLERAIQWLSDNWPSQAKWPVDISRPQPRVVAEAAR